MTHGGSAMHIAGLGLWTPGFPNAARFAEGVPEAGVETPSAGILPPRMRRRASLHTRAFVEAAGQAIESAGIEPSSLAVVCASALGETRTLGALLEMMHRDEGKLSPTRFATSVHNSAGGMLSIATDNRGFVTAIAAGTDTVAMALLEAEGLLADGQLAVLVVCGDTAPPAELLSDPNQGFQTAAAALIVTAHPTGGAVLTDLIRCTADPQTRGLEEDLARNPCSGGCELVRSVARGQEGRVRLDGGRGSGWSVRIVQTGKRQQ